MKRKRRAEAAQGIFIQITGRAFESWLPESFRTSGTRFMASGRRPVGSAWTGILS